MFKRTMLDESEREEHDALMDRACFDNDRPVKTSELGANIRRELDSAIQAGREWAGWILDDAAERGLKSIGKSWQNLNAVHETTNGEQVIVKRSDVIRTRQIDLTTGKTHWQASLWRDATVDQLKSEIAASNVRIDAERERVRDLITLLSLCLKWKVSTVSEALTCQGADLSDYLIEQAS